jgi:STE24 endopeptidase
MSETTATRKWPTWGIATITSAAVVVWILAATLLWRTSTVPGNLHLPKLDPHDYFSSAELDRTARYERFVRIDLVLSFLATAVALVVLTRRAPRITRETGLGPIGAGLIVAGIMIAVLWAVSLPFTLALRWWDGRHGLAEGSWLSWLVDTWSALGAAVPFVLLLVVIVMAFARRSPRNWWLPVTPVFVALSVFFVFILPWVIAGGAQEPTSPQLQQTVRALERREGVDVPVDVEHVSNFTTQANAFAVGLGPSERVVVWDTLLDDPFTRREVRVVLAHEFGHIAHQHLWKGMAWFVLFAFPMTFLVARVTARRGGLGDPGLLPYGALVLLLLNVPLGPVSNVVSRQFEGEADWSALVAARDPESQQHLFEKFSETSLEQPNPPTWSYIFFETHPTLMQRIAMADAWNRDYRR